MAIAPSSVLLPLSLLFILLLLSPAAMPSALPPAPGPGGAGEHAADVYIIFVSRPDYVDSVDYDVRLLASVIGSTEEARTALIYHYSSLGFTARLASDQADQLSKMEGVAIFKDETYHLDKDGPLPRFFGANR